MNYTSRFIARLVATLVTGVLSLNVVLAQDLSTRTDRTRMGQNETLVLHIKYEDRVSTDAVDLTLLERDFEIISVNPTQQTRSVNGVATSHTSWRLVLAPKRIGELEIPAFSIGSKRSGPMRITVTKAPENPSQGAKLTVEMKAERSEVHLNEQLLVTLTLTAQRAVSHLRGDPLKVPGTEVTLLDQSEYQRDVNGEIYNVFEIKYALFPSEPGEIVIQPRAYSGIVNSPPSQANMFQRGQRLLARTKTVRINVTDPASDPVASRNTPWFPATDVTISSSWSADIDTLTVGEPVTRTIQIQVKGQRAAAIPPLPEATANGYRQYADQAKLENSNTPEGVVGIRTQGTAIVPNKPGPLELPPQRLTWFDTTARKWRTAVLKATTVNVAPGASAPADVASPSASPAIIVQAPTPSAPANPAVLNWLTIVLGVISAGLAAACLMLWKRVNALQSSTRPDPNVAASEQQAWKDVNKALARRAPAEARTAITRWFAHLSGHPTGSQQPTEFRSSVTALNAALYAKDAVEPDYAGIRSALESLRKRLDTKAVKSTKPSLPELYPQSGAD